MMKVWVLLLIGLGLLVFAIPGIPEVSDLSVIAKWRALKARGSQC